MHCITSLADIDNVVANNKSLVIILFWAPWSDSSKHMVEVLETISEEPDCAHAFYSKVEAEAVPEVTQKYAVTAVPTCLFLQAGKVIDRVDGVHAADLTRKAKLHCANVHNFIPAEQKQQSNEPIEERLKALINRAPVMLFMKGSPTEPFCGFSRKLVNILDEASVKYDYFDILKDEEVRQQLKVYSNWPTYPQLYVKGELIGGIDIVQELKESGELTTALAAGHA